MTEQNLTIGDVLAEPYAFPWNHAVFANSENISDEGAHCLVLDPDDVETDEDEEPAEAQRHGYTYVLSIQDIQSIAANLKAQGGVTTKGQMLPAFIHYVERDAFIVLSIDGH